MARPFYPQLRLHRHVRKVPTTEVASNYLTQIGLIGKQLEDGVYAGGTAGHDVNS